MRGLRPEWIGALAGVGLVVLLFVTWYELDSASIMRQTEESLGSGVLGYLNTYSGGDAPTAWDTYPRVSLVWIASAVTAFAAALVPWLGLGHFATRWTTAAALGVAVVGFVLAALRLIDPPLESYSVAAPAYGAAALSAVMLATAVLSLRRA